MHCDLTIHSWRRAWFAFVRGLKGNRILRPLKHVGLQQHQVSISGTR